MHLIFAVKTVKLMINKSTGPIILIFLCAGIIPCLFSGSYLTTWSFWTMMGIVVTLSLSAKHKKIENVKEDQVELLNNQNHRLES